MFLDLKKDSELKRSYFEMLKYRLAYGSLELEGMSGDLASIKQSMKIYNQLNAMNYVFGERIVDDLKREQNEEDLTDESTIEDYIIEPYNANGTINPYDFFRFVCNVVSKVSGGEIDAFRKTQAIVQGSSIPRSPASMIRNDLMYLVDNYNYQITHYENPEDVYGIEAEFHKKFLHIHPFEDGNGRTARLLTTMHLCKADLPPAIITMETKREYCDLIENNDTKGLANMMQKLSEAEIGTVASLYRELESKGLVEQGEETPSTGMKM